MEYGGEGGVPGGGITPVVIDVLDALDAGDVLQDLGTGDLASGSPSTSGWDVALILNPPYTSACSAYT